MHKEFKICIIWKEVRTTNRLVNNPWNLSPTKVIHEKCTSEVKETIEMRWTSRTQKKPEKTQKRTPLKENSKGTYVRSEEAGRSSARRCHRQAPLGRRACIPACTHTWRCSGSVAFRWRSSSRRSGWGQGGRTPGLAREGSVVRGRGTFSVIEGCE